MRTSALAAACFTIGTGIVLCGFAPQAARPSGSEYPTPEIREEQQIAVDGFTETWQLKWTAPPSPVCGASEDSLVFPCSGFAFGEGGDLVLTRSRVGSEIDRLSITNLFEEESVGAGRMAVVQRWQADYDKDFEASANDDFAELVAKRPVVQIMHFFDYDHDGQSTEFYLHTDTEPSVKNVGVVIGVSRKNPRLHAFATSMKPGKPLYMLKENWEALRDASGPIDVVSWVCGDHGAENESTIRLLWTPNGIEGTRREFSCPEDPSAKKLLSEEPL